MQACLWSESSPAKHDHVHTGRFPTHLPDHQPAAQSDCGEQCDDHQHDH